MFDAPHRAGLTEGERVSLAIRPEQVLLGTEAEGMPSRLRASVRDISYQGAIIRYRLDLHGQILIAETPNRGGRAEYNPDETVTVAWPVDAGEILAD